MSIKKKDDLKRKEEQGPVLKLAHPNGIFGGKPRGSADDGGLGKGGGGVVSGAVSSYSRCYTGQWA